MLGTSQLNVKTVILVVHLHYEEESPDWHFVLKNLEVSMFCSLAESLSNVTRSDL